MACIHPPLTEAKVERLERIENYDGWETTSRSVALWKNVACFKSGEREKS